MTDQNVRKRTFESNDRPDVALITNHGYAGVEIPIGGAPDTGGQVVYVNTLAQTLADIGYRVTVFARGGFPYFESDKIRSEPEYISDYARYVFIQDSCDEFIRKEDIALVLDEEVAWLDAFIRSEAQARGRTPQTLYDFINTHYWDAGVLGMRLVERWRNDIVSEILTDLLTGVIPSQKLKTLHDDRHWLALSESPSLHLGTLLLESEGTPGDALMDKLPAAAGRWTRKSRHGAGLDGKAIAYSAQRAVTAAAHKAPVLHTTIVAEAMGNAVFAVCHNHSRRMEREMAAADRHIWTPHSLGELKDENFRDSPLDVRQSLKFCERRNHERILCHRTRAFAATSDEIAERLNSHYRVSADSVFYFPPCVDNNVFRPYSEEETAEAYAYLSQISGVPVETLRKGKIVFETSRMDQTKRKDLLLESFALAARETQDSYLFIGGGPDNDLFKYLTETRDANADLTGRAFLTGFIPEEHIGPLFSIADVFVSASEMEGFGMSVSQAAAAETAIVSSDLIPFSVQYVPDAAMLVPAGDQEGFARAILHLLKDDADRKQRAAALAEKVKVLNWRRQSELLVDFMQDIGIAPRTEGVQA